MTELALDAHIREPDREPAVLAEPEVLITEHEVLLSSAAALAGPTVRVPRSRWRAAFVVFRPRRRQRPQRNHTRRPSFIEDAMMARMMERL
ncbi:hypothetical protein GR927_33805 [Mycolicibacterium sp. 3033]|nr:hypothetical protein [Mycolicibacterium aurantiacum]